MRQDSKRAARALRYSSDIWALFGIESANLNKSAPSLAVIRGRDRDKLDNAKIAAGCKA